MGWRLAVVWMLLFAFCTGCPHAWGRGGTIDQASAQDIDEMLHEEECPLGVTAWKKRCANAADWDSLECPRECRLVYP